MNDITALLRKAKLCQYGKVRRLQGGDMMHASALVSIGDDKRDASYVWVCTICASCDGN